MAKSKPAHNRPARRAEVEQVEMVRSIVEAHGGSIELKRGRRHLRALVSLGGKSGWITMSGSPRGGVDFAVNYMRQQTERLCRALKGETR